MHRTSKRITLFAGHYGSGKTTVAMNYALWLRSRRLKVAVCDLDIVNPYFRAADWAGILSREDISLISSEYANTNIEAPYLPAAAQSIFDDPHLTAVIDVGGDEQGALALGRYARLIHRENDYEMFMVINRYRPLTRDVQSLKEIRQMIEDASGIKFTGLLNNANVGAQTTLEDIRASLAFAEETAQALALPLSLTAALAPIAEDMLSWGNGSAAAAQISGSLFPIRLLKDFQP